MDKFRGSGIPILTQEGLSQLTFRRTSSSLLTPESLQPTKRLSTAPFKRGRSSIALLSPDSPRTAAAVAERQEIERKIRENYRKFKKQIDEIEVNSSLLVHFEPRWLEYSAARNPQYYKDLKENKGNLPYRDQLENLSSTGLFGLQISAVDKKLKSKEAGSLAIENQANLDLVSQLFFTKTPQHASGRAATARLYTFARKTKFDFGETFRGLEEAILRSSNDTEISQALLINDSDSEEVAVIKKLIRKALTLHNEEGRSAQTLPIAFWKYIALCETRLIKHQVDKIAYYVKHAHQAVRENRSNTAEVLLEGLMGASPDVRKMRLARFKTETEKYVTAYKCLVTIPAERSRDQIDGLRTSDSLNPPQRAPHILPCFISRVEGREIAIGEAFSADQINMLIGIDAAIAYNVKAKVAPKTVEKKAVLFKKSEVVMRAGTGKSYVMDRLTSYESLYPNGIFKINLNSSPQEIIAVFNAPSNAGRLVILDEVSFYSSSPNFLPMLMARNQKLSPSSTPQELERAMIKAIRDIRKQGATVELCGASKSIEKVKIEIARIQKKIENLDVKIENDRADNQGPLKQKNILLALKEFYKKYYGASRLTAPHHLTITRGYNPLAYFQDCIVDLLKRDRDAKLDEMAIPEAQGALDEDTIVKLKQDFYSFCDRNPNILTLLDAKLKSLEAGELGLLNNNLQAFEAKKRDLEVARAIKVNQLEDLSAERAAALARVRKAECDFVYREPKSGVKPGTARLHEVIGYLAIKPGQRVQYILPDTKISDDDAAPKQLATILDVVQKNTGANVIIVSCKIKGDDGKQELGYQVLCKNLSAPGAPYQLKKPLTRTQFKKFLEEEILAKQSRYSDGADRVSILSIFTGDPATAVGGDYFDASLLTGADAEKGKVSDRQVIHFQRDQSDKAIMADHIVQFTKRNRADEDDLMRADIERVVIMEGGEVKTKDALLQKIEEDTKTYDKDHVRAYLQEKIEDLEDITDPDHVEKRLFYQKLLGDLDQVVEASSEALVRRASSASLFGSSSDAKHVIDESIDAEDMALFSQSWIEPGALLQSVVEESGDEDIQEDASAYEAGDEQDSFESRSEHDSEEIHSDGDESEGRGDGENSVFSPIVGDIGNSSLMPPVMSRGAERETSTTDLPVSSDEVQADLPSPFSEAKYTIKRESTVIDLTPLPPVATTTTREIPSRGRLDFAQSADLVFGGDLKAAAGGWRDVHYDTATQRNKVVDRRTYSAGEKKQTIKSFISAYAEISANIKTKLSDEELTPRDKRNLLELELHKKSALFALTCPGLNQEQFKTLCNAKTMDIKIDGEKTVGEYFVEAVTTLQDDAYRGSFLRVYEYQLKDDLGVLHERKKVSEQDTRPGKSISARQIQNMSIEQKISLIVDGGR